MHIYSHCPEIVTNNQIFLREFLLQGYTGMQLFIEHIQALRTPVMSPTKKPVEPPPRLLTGLVV